MLIYGLPLVALVLTFGGCQREEPAHPAEACRHGFQWVG